MSSFQEGDYLLLDLDFVPERGLTTADGLAEEDFRA
jgi:hypothetical protein